MRKTVLSRGGGLLALYAVLLFALVLVQFARQGGFTRQVGALEISGHYKQGAGIFAGEEVETPAGYPLEGEVDLMFAGLQFVLAREGSSNFALVDANGYRTPLVPIQMTLSQDAVHFRLSESEELIFYIRHSSANEADTEELIISGVFPENAAEIEIPFFILGSAKVSEELEHNVVISTGGAAYSFDRPIVDMKRRVLSLSVKDPIVSYRAAEQTPAFNPVEFILSGGMEKSQYAGLVNQWANLAFAVWQKEVVLSDASEELVTSYVAEAARRDTYSAAVSAVPASFRSSARRTYRSSPFLGGLTDAQRSLSAAEKSRIASLTELLENDLPAALREEHIIEYLAVRGRNMDIDRLAAYVRLLDADALSDDLWPPVLELWRDWFIWRPDTDNPFALFAEAVCSRVSARLRKDAEGQHVLVLDGAGSSQVDTLFNLRLGVALAEYGEFTGKSEWAAVGRSLVLSVLSLSGEEGEVASSLVFSPEDAVTPEEGEEIPALEIYHILSLSEFSPRAASLGMGSQGDIVWVWTISPALSMKEESDTLTITVNFPVGEAHYLILRGIRPFTKIQLRNMDYRSDPQFEIYNAPGWAYAASEQSLLVKLVHRTENENIKIFF